MTARQVLTPGDLEPEYGLTGGHPLHAEPALDSFFLWRPLLGWARYRMPVEGLYLAGSGRAPGWRRHGRAGPQRGARGHRGPRSAAAGSAGAAPRDRADAADAVASSSVRPAARPDPASGELGPAFAASDRPSSTPPMSRPAAASPFGTLPSGVIASMTVGRAAARIGSNAPTSRPLWPASCCTLSGPSAAPSAFGSTGLFGPVETHELDRVAEPRLAELVHEALEAALAADEAADRTGDVADPAGPPDATEHLAEVVHDPDLAACRQGPRVPPCERSA